MSTKRGFTLIEVLVVVSIIALIIAILLPVLANTFFVTRTTVCTARLQQLGIATTSYAIDNDGYMPHKMLPTTDRYLNALDGEFYRWEETPWVIKANNQYNYIPLIEPYVSDLSEVFVCPHIDFDWDDNNYHGQTGATMIPYAMYWGISNTGTPTASRIPMTQLGFGFGPGTRLDGGGITFDSRYRILASDYVRLGLSHGIKYPDGTSITTPKSMANHPPTDGDYFYAGSNNGNGAGYVYDTTTNGNANYLYDDGSVVLYGQINKDTIGDNAEHEFRRAERWLAPTERVDINN